MAATEMNLSLVDPLVGDPHRIFEALLDEHDYVIDEVEGTLPAGLRGTLYRNGPGRWEAGGQPLGHIFDGDGMLSMFAIDGEQVRYRNRYVRTNHYLGAQGAVGELVLTGGDAREQPRCTSQIKGFLGYRAVSVHRPDLAWTGQALRRKARPGRLRQRHRRQ